MVGNDDDDDDDDFFLMITFIVKIVEGNRYLQHDFKNYQNLIR